MRGAHALIRRARAKAEAMLVDVERRNILSAAMLTPSPRKVHTGLSRVNGRAARYHQVEVRWMSDWHARVRVTSSTTGILR